MCPAVSDSVFSMMLPSLVPLNFEWSSAQVLDLGVTRLLVHSSVNIYPSLYEGHELICGSLVATYAASNGRLQFLGQRSRAKLAGSG